LRVSYFEFVAFTMSYKLEAKHTMYKPPEKWKTTDIYWLQHHHAHTFCSEKR
jgi:hypothetical protein